MKQRLIKKNGFTLIELLVVIAIIGILSAIVLTSLGSAKQKGRDARRVSDIKSIQLALELYYDASSAYPTSLSSLAPSYISVVPNDPLTNAAYSYAALEGAAPSVGTCAAYHLGSSLEQTTNSALTGDADGVVGGTYGSGTNDGTVCTGGGTDFAGIAATCGASAGATDGCYDVKP